MWLCTSIFKRLASAKKKKEDLETVRGITLLRQKFKHNLNNLALKKIAAKKQLFPQSGKLIFRCYKLIITLPFNILKSFQKNISGFFKCLEAKFHRTESL